PAAKQTTTIQCESSWAPPRNLPDWTHRRTHCHRQSRGSSTLGFCLPVEAGGGVWLFSVALRPLNPVVSRSPPASSGNNVSNSPATLPRSTTSPPASDPRRYRPSRRRAEAPPTPAPRRLRAQSIPSHHPQLPTLRASPLGKTPCGRSQETA